MGSLRALACSIRRSTISLRLQKYYFVAFILFILITKSGSCFPGFFLPFWLILQTIFVYAYIPFVALGILEV